MRHSPDDTPLNKVLRAEIEQTAKNERVIFIDTDNNVREAVYPSEFNSGVLQSVRKRLEDSGVLKAVVHISATSDGSPSGHGSRVSVIEYLPDQEYFFMRVQPPFGAWLPEDPAALEATQKLFREEE